MTNRPSLVEISIPRASFDGRYYGRYPNGNAPGSGMVGAAIDVVSVTGVLQGGSLPAWWPNVAPNSWAAIAGGAGFGAAWQNGARLTDVQQQPLSTAVFPPGNSYSGHFSGILDSWGGASLHPIRGEYMIVNNGGHADYSGNEGYGVRLFDDIPGYRRYMDYTPNAILSDSTQFNTTHWYYEDGFPRSQHSSGFPTYGDGKIWYPACNSVTDPAGNGADQVISFNREDATLIAALAAGSPLAYGVMTSYGQLSAGGTGIGPWNYYGTTNVAGQNWPFGYAVFDPNSHRVYAISNYSTSALQIWGFATQGAQIGISSGVSNANGAGASPPRPSWMCICPDLRIIVFGSNGSFFPGTLWVYDIASEATNGGANHGLVSQVASVSGDIGPGGQAGWYGHSVGTGLAFDSDSGACYVPGTSTKCIFVGSPRDLANVFWKLQIPLKVDGTYNPAGNWVWTKVTPATGSTDTASWCQDTHAAQPPNNGCFNKLQCLQFPDGTFGVVFCGLVGGPTWVYKIPAAGL